MSDQTQSTTSTDAPESAPECACDTPANFEQEQSGTNHASRPINPALPGTPAERHAHRQKKVGSIEIAHPFTLAALSGYSDLGMRMVCRSLGASMTRHELVLDRVINDGAHGARNGRHLDDADRPVAAQLLGNQPAEMAQAARNMVSFGYDMIDINFGCPVKKVLGRCRGGFLLQEPEQALALVQAVRDAVDVPVTTKMRRGIDDSPEAEDWFWEILEKSIDIGIAAVTVHGRTVRQGYIGPSRWDILRRVKQRFPSLYVFGSGDLFTAEDCINMLDETGIDGVTIARGAIDNPFVFRDCLALWNGEPKLLPPTLAEQRALFDLQFAYSVRQYGEERASRQMRKFGIKRAHLHPLGNKVRDAFISIKNLADWHLVSEQYYGFSAPHTESERA